ncbi:MAG: sulfurtransferase-like selenium metabolism protein YedF [bacterium]
MEQVITIDARGLACPGPVLKTKAALEEDPGAAIEVLVDNEGSSENVLRFARSQGRAARSVAEGAAFRVLIGSGEPSGLPAREPSPSPDPASPEPLPACRDGGLVLYVGADQMGRGSEDLGRKLMRGFLRTWLDGERKPWRILFLNSGVRLTTVDEEAVEILELLEHRGVEVLSCGTCLEHFGLIQALRVGRVTNMYEIVETFSAAHRVVSPA